MQHKADVLVVTVTEVETRAVLAAFKRVTGRKGIIVHLHDRVYRDLGEVNGARVFLALSEMGTSGLGASLQTVHRGIEALQPDAVVMVGIAYGVNEGKQAIGDVLISQQLMLYEVQRVGATAILPRGDRPRASARLISYVKSASIDWRGAQVRTGLLLTGEKLVDNIDYRAQLLELEAEAIGGEMEGGGLYTACQDAHVDWILIKAICDWGDGNKSHDKAARQKLAAKNAAQFLVHALEHAPWSRPKFLIGVETASVIAQSETAPWRSESTVPQFDVTDPTKPAQNLQIDTLHVPGNNNNVTIQQFCSGPPTSLTIAHQQRPVATCKVDDDGIRRLTDELELAAAEVLEWPSTLPSGKNILRSEAETIEGALTDPEIKLISLLGEAGSGKSALLATIGSAQKAAGRQVVGMRLDRLPKDAVDAEHLRLYLGLSVPFVEAITALATKAPVLVLIDQLDALCDLMTERAGRLSLILNTVEQLAKIERVHVVLAIRPFEYKHDVRLRRVKAEEISLELPSWEDVAPHVLAAGVEPAGLSEDLREDLRKPQALRTFLDLLATGWDWLQLRTYHEMRERLWESHVESAHDRVRRRGLLFDLARWMGSFEQLNRPLAQMDDWRTEIGALESAGWLRRTKDASATGVSFRHQSLFDFVYARAMIADGLSLLEQVTQKQGLFIRRRVWSVLTYLREQSLEQYLREMSRLWHAPKLRHHLKRLILDFLGQLTNPCSQEVGMMRQSLRDSTWRTPALVATARGRGWFPHLRDRELPDAMANPELAGICTSILAEAPSEHTDAVLSLLERCWLSDAQGAQRIVLVLSRRTDWNERAVLIAQRAVAMLPLAQSYWFEELVSAAMSISLPAAVALVKVSINAELSRRVDMMRLVPAPSAPAKDKTEQYVTWRWELSKRKEPIRGLLEEQAFRGRLTELVDEAPAEFLKQLWPVLEQALEIVADSARQPDTFRSELHWPRGLSPEPSSLIDYLRTAIKTMAASEPERFRDFLASAGKSDLISIHILLLEGLLILVESNPDVIVSYFRQDPRRMRIGRMFQDATLRFLLRASSKLSSSTQQELADIFLLSSIPDSNTGDCDARSRWQQLRFTRECRLQLLLCLDRNKLTQPQCSRIEQEWRAQPNVQQPSIQNFREPRAVDIQSAMSAPQMQKASDEEIVNFFRSLPDDTEWDHPTRSMQGGSIQASRELAQLTSDNPNRGLHLARLLADEAHLRPVGMVLEAAAKAGTDYSTLMQDIQRYQALGFNKLKYQVHVADALSSIAQRDGQQGLPDEACELLRSWLREVNRTDRDIEHVSGKDLPLHSIITNHGGLFSLPAGNYSILRALSLAYLKRQPPGLKAWTSIIAEHAERQDEPRVWQALAHHELRYLVGVDPACGLQVLSTLFCRFPELLDVQQGLLLLNDCQRRFPAELTRAWLDALRHRGTEWHAQSYGELLILRACHQIDDAWTLSEIDRLLTNTHPAEPDVCAIHHGMAYMAAWVIAEGNAPERAIDWLLRLGRTEHPAIRAALLSVFRYQDAPLYAPRIEALLKLFIAQPYHLHGPGLTGLIWALEEYVALAPELVLAVANALVEAPEAQGDSTPPAARHVPELINLALTLQNIPGQLDAGLDLFERLQNLNSYECESVLSEGEMFSLHHAKRLPIRPKRRRRIASSTAQTN